MPALIRLELFKYMTAELYCVKIYQRAEVGVRVADGPEQEVEAVWAECDHYLNVDFSRFAASSPEMAIQAVLDDYLRFWEFHRGRGAPPQKGGG